MPLVYSQVTYPNLKAVALMPFIKGPEWNTIGGSYMTRQHNNTKWAMSPYWKAVMACQAETYEG